MRVRRLAYPLFGLWAALALAACVLQAGGSDAIDAFLTPALGVLAGVGALLSRRLPENPIGPILLGLALAVTVSVVGDGITARYDDDPDPGLGVRLIVWIDEAIIFVWFGLVGLLLPLLFPDGRLPSRRWRPLLWAGLALVALAVLGTLFGVEQGDSDGPGAIRQPAGHRRPRGRRARSRRCGRRAAVRRRSCCSRWPASWRASAARAASSASSSSGSAYAIGLLLCGLAAAAISEATGWQLIGDVGWTVFL